MIEKTELTEEERITLKTIVLERQKEKIEKEIQEMKESNTNKDNAERIAKYFKD